MTAEDCGSNFFVSVEEIGKPRAQVTSEMLKEMNAEVKGEWVEGDAASTSRPPLPMVSAAVCAHGAARCYARCYVAD